MPDAAEFPSSPWWRPGTFLSHRCGARSHGAGRTPYALKPSAGFHARRRDGDQSRTRNTIRRVEKWNAMSYQGE